MNRWGSYNNGNRNFRAFANTYQKNNKVTFQLLRWGDNEGGNKFKPTVENLQNIFVHQEGRHYLKNIGQKLRIILWYFNSKCLSSNLEWNNPLF